MKREVLENTVKILNRLVGNSLSPVITNEEGKRIFVPGVYQLSIISRRYDLERVESENGASSSIFNMGHQTAEILYKMIVAYMEGIKNEN
jgi:hypothetical protein